MNDPGLEVGAQGEAVRRLHEALSQAGYQIPQGEVARQFFGPATRDAVIRYQQDHALPVNGRADQATLSLLSASPPTEPADAAAAGTPPTARRQAVPGESRSGPALARESAAASSFRPLPVDSVVRALAALPPIQSDDADLREDPMSGVTLSTATWTPIGPAPVNTADARKIISGRVQAAAPDPTAPDTIYLGADNGGVWKNINPPSWTPLTDQQPSLQFGAGFSYHPLVVHPADHRLVLGLVSGPGAGILKSVNAGQDWQLLANSQFNNQGLQSLAVHPTDVKTMYLAAGWAGAWKSVNCGTSWTPISGLPAGGFVCDLIIAGFDSNSLYAAVIGLSSGAAQAQNGVYQSTDGKGAVWTQLSGGLPAGAALGALDANGNPVGAVRIESGTRAGAVYVSMLTVTTSGSQPPAVTAVQRFGTTDGGTSWSPLAASPGTLEWRPWHLLLAVDPGNDHHIFVNDAYALFESTNAGQNWAPADTNIPPGFKYDYVNLTFDANGQAVVTGDQGVWRHDAATQTLTSLIGDLEVSQFYTICLDPSTAGVAYAVGQDIGSAKFSGQTGWQAIGGVGETGKFIVNPKTSELFGFNPLDTSNFVVTSPDAGKTWNKVFPASKLSAAFLTTYNTSKGYGFAYLSQKAFAMDPSNPARLLVVADRVFETTNSGGTWNEISGMLSQDANNPFVAALAIAPSHPNTVYASTQDGHLWVTHDDGATAWAQLDTGLSGVVIDIRVDPSDANHAFTVTNNKVWHLPSSATTWVNITGSIPNDLSLYTVFVAWGPAVPALFVGTDRGIYRSDDLGTTWAKWVIAGLPNTRVNDLQGETLNGQLLLAAATYGRGAWEIPARAVNFEIHRDHYGQAEIDAIRSQSLTGDAVVGGGPLQSPICVTVDGFTARELNITDAGSYAVGPSVSFNPSTGVKSPARPVSLDSTEGSFPPDDPQRFRFHYNVDFGTDDSAFNFSGSTEPVQLSTTYQGMTANGQVTFMKQPDPFIMQGAQTWWLSSDVRLIQVAQDDTAFGVQMETDPFQFLKDVTDTLTQHQGRVPVPGGAIESFDDNIDEQQEMITTAPQALRAGSLVPVPVFNFAIARVHYQAVTQPASDVRVFFRLFEGNSTDTTFHVGSTYRRVPADYPVPLAKYRQPITATGGVVGSEYVSLPCYGVLRQAPDQSGTAGTLPAKQFDTFNDRPLSATGGPVKDTFYGAFLDINQPGNALPHTVPAGNPDGPWPPGTPGNSDLEPLAKAFARNDHHCIVAEIAFDPVTIADGTQPFNSDKLAQRNLAWSTVANPGTPASRIAFQNFEVRPSPVFVQAGDTPDEILIDWNTIPPGSTAEIYLPAVDADAVIATADRLYPHRLSRVDAHTIGVPAGGLTYIPLPTGVAGGANFAGLISVELPAGIRAGELHTLTVHQLTRATVDITPPPPPPRIQIEAVPGRNNKSGDSRNTISWRTVLGSFQINVPVSTKQLMLPEEEIRLSIFRWIAQSIAPSERWYPVFERFLGLLANKVAGLGGDPARIMPSPNGFDGIPSKHEPHPPAPPEHERFQYVGVTGKIDGLLYDHFGDFEGFVLELFDGTKRKFASRQRDIETLACAALEHRTLVTVSHTEHDPEAVRTLALRTHAPWRPHGHWPSP